MIGIMAAFGICSIFSTDFNLAYGASKPTVKVKLNHNTYFYNKAGKRVGKDKLLKNETLQINGSIEKLSEDKKYYFYKSRATINENKNYVYSPDELGLYAYKEKCWVPYTIIKGKAYYKTSNNRFIKVMNVKDINNTALLATSGTVKIKKNTVFYDSKGEPTKTKIKKGKQFSVNKYENLKPQMAINLGYYRVKGTNKYLYAYYVDKPRVPLEYVPKSTKSTYVNLMKNTVIYNGNGTVKLQVDLNHMPNSWKVDELRYIWNPSEKKAELFYHIDNSDPWENSRGGYISASDVIYAGGPKLLPINTPQTAEKWQ